MKLRFLALALILFSILGTSAAASEAAAEQTDPPASISSAIQPPQEDENTHIKTTPEGIRYSVKADGTVRIEGCRTAPVKLQLPSSIDERTVNEIAPAAFQKDSGLIGIVIPDSITVIGQRAFESCENLTSVTLPDTLTLIPYRCFAQCTALRTVALPTSLVRIGEQAFVGCTLLGTLDVPPSLNEIGAESFFGCERLLLSCNGNDYAEQYAKEHRIPTSFFETDNAQLLSITVLSIIGFLVIFLVGKRRKKRKANNKKTAKA